MCSFYKLLISFVKKYISNDYIHTAHIFNFIGAIYDWIFKTLINCLNWLSRWYGSYRRAANSYPPAYRGCHINTEHIFNYISAIYDWIFKTLIYCLNLLSRWCRFIQAGWKQLFPCLSGMSHQYCKYFQFYQGHLWLNSLKLWDRGLKFS